MLLSLLPPSCMVVPNRESVNTLFSFNFSLLSDPQVHYSNMAIDMEVDTPRGRSINSSTNNSRALSVYSNTSSIAYTERIQALNNNLS